MPVFIYSISEFRYANITVILAADATCSMEQVAAREE